MEKMEKVCPSCGRKCPEVAGFCPGCGTNIQAVQPTPTQAAVAMNQLQEVAGTAMETVKKVTKGVPFTYFIPAIISLINILFLSAFDWFKFKSDYDRMTLTFSELLEIFNEEDAEILSVLFGGVIAIGFIFAIIGAVLLIMKKTVGKVLYFIGSGINLLDAIALVAIFIIMSVEYGDITVTPQIGFVLFLLATVAGIVFAAISKTGKKLQLQQNINAPMMQYQNNYNNYNNNNFHQF